MSTAIGSHSECCITSVINRLVSNTSPEAHHAIELLAEAHHAHSSSRFLLPPHSSFLLSEMHLWHDQLLCIFSFTLPSSCAYGLSSATSTFPSRFGLARVCALIYRLCLIRHLQGSTMAKQKRPKIDLLRDNGHLLALLHQLAFHPLSQW